MKLNFYTKLLLLLAGLVFTLLATAGAFLSQGKVLGERHDGVAQVPFDYEGSDFADYVAWNVETTRAGRLDNPPSAVIDNLASFVLTPNAACPRAADGKFARGALLIHGLIDSPYSMRAFGEYLQSQCFYVLGLLLPDHGTRPGDFLDAHWEDWAEAAHFATGQLAQEAEQLFIAGHSAGGTLALLEAERNPAVDALILFAPALGITGSAKYAKYVALLGKLFPGAAWFEVKPDEAVYRYESFTFSAAAETWELIQATQAELAEPRELPVFAVASQEDSTVSTPAILEYMQRNSHAASRTLLYSQEPLLMDERIQLVQSAIPEENILGVSHLGLMTPPSHPYYGKHGEYRNCGHYRAASDEYLRCKSGQGQYFGEVTTGNLERGLVERIAYNPFYEDMLERLRIFLEAVEN